MKATNTIYWSASDMLSYNRLFNFVVGNRGGGKTFAMKSWCISDFLKKGKEFVWVRRYKNEMKTLQQFFSDIEQFYPNVKFEVKGKVAYINSKPAGYFINLSTASQNKSTSYSMVNKIIFDEFIIDKGAIRYLPNEAEAFLELYETVARLRDDVRAIFIGNALSIVNPYFTYFGIAPKAGERFTVKNQLLIELVAKQDFIDAKNKTRFGQLIANTSYGSYAIDNEFLRDNDDFIGSKTNTAYYQGALRYKEKYYGIWIDADNGKIYINNKVNLDCQRCFCITKEDHTVNTLLLEQQNKLPLIKTLRDSFRIGIIYYDTQQTKQAFYEILGILSIR